MNHSWCDVPIGVRSETTGVWRVGEWIRDMPRDLDDHIDSRTINHHAIIIDACQSSINNDL